MMDRRAAVLFMAGMTFVIASLPAHAASKAGGKDNMVFRIGTFNRSSIEFVPGVPKEAVNFVVGRSDPAKDWYAAQRAVLASGQKAGKTNAANAPRTITFSLNRAPTAACRLRIAVMIETPSVPAVQVTVNGKRGKFYLHPRLDYSNGDQTDSFFPAYSYAEIEFAFPGSYLHQGSNTITLGAIEEAGRSVPWAGFTYDAIELDRDISAFHVRSSTARIDPTIFYQRRQGKLDERVDVFFRRKEPIRAGSKMELAVAGQRYRKALGDDRDFGEEKIEFEVRQFQPNTQAHLTWTLNGRRWREDQTLNPKKKWTIFLVPHIHLDIGYSDYQAKVATIQSHDVDEALDMISKCPGFRFSLDGQWSLEQFMKTRTPAQRQRAVQAMRDRRLFVPADYANLLTGFPTAETLIRSLYPSADFSRTHGTPFNYATITDVPSYSWSYASILASAGIKDLLGGSNNYRAPVLLQGRLNEDSPIWWEGPDGQKVLLWYSRIYFQMQNLFGLPPLIAAGHDSLPLFLQMYEHPGYRADAAILYGTQVENTDLFPQQAELAQKWNGIYAYPHIQYSGFYAALQNIAKQFGDTIPTMRGGGGPYWEDGIASDAYYAAIERQNEDRAPSAEKLATLTGLVNPLLAANKAGLDNMWRNIVLMDEHTFDAYDSVSEPASMQAVKQLAIKNQYAIDAQGQVDFLAREAMANLVNSISAYPWDIMVFNTLNWKRSGPVSIDLNKGNEIVDRSTGQAMPIEILDRHSKYDHVRFVAQNVPAVGYKVYEVRPAPEPPPAKTGNITVIESPYYRVTLDPVAGAIESIYDKQLHRELVNEQSPYRFGQYLYVTGGDKSPNTVLQYSRVYPKPRLTVQPASGGSLVSVTHTPYGWVARMKSQDTNTPAITTEVRLFDRAKKIEVVEEVDKKKVYTKEAVYFAFPFEMKQPEFQYEIQDGVIDPARDLYPGAGHEWFSVQHWVSVQQNGVSATVMPLDASLVTLGDIFRGDWLTRFGKRPGTIFSYAMNNYWDTNYAAGQGGCLRFRYVITSGHSTDAAKLSRMGWEEATPLEEGRVSTQDKALKNPRPLSGREGSFLDVQGPDDRQDPDLLLETWKPAEDGDGTILRFLDLGGASRTDTVNTPLLDLKEAWETDAVERNRKPLSLLGAHGFQFNVRPHEIVTVRLVGTDVTQPPALN